MTSAMSELRRRVRAEQSPPRFDPCLPRAAAGPKTMLRFGDLSFQQAPIM
jgi:hypothetical protein